MASGRKTIKLTKKDLSALPLREGWVNIEDSQIARLRVNSGKSKKVIYIRRRVKRGDIHFKVCDWESYISPEQIRKKAVEVATQILNNSDPNTEKKKSAAKAVTLEEAFESYIKTRRMGKNAIKPSTEEQYRFAYTKDLKKWKKGRLAVSQVMRLKRCTSTGLRSHLPGRIWPHGY